MTLEEVRGLEWIPESQALMQYLPTQQSHTILYVGRETVKEALNTLCTKLSETLDLSFEDLSSVFQEKNKAFLHQYKELYELFWGYPITGKEMQELAQMFMMPQLK